MSKHEHTGIRIPQQIIQQISESNNDFSSGLADSQKRKRQIPRKERRKQDRQKKRKVHHNGNGMTKSEETGKNHPKSKKTSMQNEVKKEQKKTSKSPNPKKSVAADFDPIPERDKQLMAQDEAEMEHYAKLLKMKNFKLSNADDGLDDLLGDLDFDDFGNSGADDDMSDALSDADADGATDQEIQDTWAALKKAKEKKLKAQSGHQHSSEDEEDASDASDLDLVEDGDEDEDDEVDLDELSDFEGFDDDDDDDAVDDLGGDDTGSDGEEDDIDGIEDDDNETAEDTWAALKKLKEKKMAASTSDDNNKLLDPTKQKTNAKENPYVAPTAYIPPSKRAALAAAAAAATAEKDSEVNALLRRKVKGLLNRLAESNIPGIVNDLVNLFSLHPRSHVNEAITAIILETAEMQPTVIDTSVAVHAAVVTALYRRIGVEFGAYFVQKLTERFNSISGIPVASETATTSSSAPPTSSASREAVNLLSLLCQTYNFQLVSPRLMYDLVRMFLQSISEATTEYLLIIVKTAGPQLRSDDPASLKEIILLLQQQVSGTKQNARTRFLIETIIALKNNRQKLPESTVAIISRLKKFLSSSFQKLDPLQVSLQDIQNIETKGRWWIVGAAYKNVNVEANSRHDIFGHSASKNNNGSVVVKSLTDDDFLPTQNLSDLAVSQRMNTDIRKAIFVALMSSEDYVDSVERISHLHLTNKQEKDIPLVLMHCCANEETYNPFYALVASKLCANDKRLSKAFQFTLWNYLDNLATVKLEVVVHVAKLFGTLAADGSIGLDVLKTVDMYTSTKTLRAFLEVFFVHMLSVMTKKSKEYQKQLAGMVIKCEADPDLLHGIHFFQQAVLSSSALPEKAKTRKRVETASKVLSELIRGVVDEA